MNGITRFSAVLIFGLPMIALLLYQKALWLPWVSPDHAVQYLLMDDGKGPFNTSRQATKYWGNEIYAPLEEHTEGFDKFNGHVAALTIYELVLDGREVDSGIGLKMLSSKGKYSKMLGCLILSGRAKSEEHEDFCLDYLTEISKTGTHSQSALAKKVLKRINNFS